MSLRLYCPQRQGWATPINHWEGNAIHRRSIVALLGLILLVSFIATLANRVPSPIVFADNTSATSTLWASGLNTWGQLGDGTTADKNSHTQESTGATNWSAISVGGYHTVALKSDGTLWAWGSNSDGQLGDSTTVDDLPPIVVPLLMLVQPRPWVLCSRW